MNPSIIQQLEKGKVLTTFNNLKGVKLIALTDGET
jgi:hypothetical protein